MKTITPAERTGIASIAKTMSVEDLQWQVDNAKRVRVTGDALKIFKAELARKKAEKH